MYLMDVNVLVYAHREDTLEHSAYREWLESIINDTVPYGYSELVLSGFLRVVTHPRIFEEPSALSRATRFVNQIRESQHAALAMEWNCIWVTTDKGFKRFKGLKVRHPLALLDS